MSGTVYCDGSLNSLKLSDSNRVSEERLSAVVSAHQTGLDHVTKQLIDQLTGACAV